MGVRERAEAMLRGQRALVIGLAREGIDLKKFLVAHGALVRVTDQKTREQLQDAFAQVEGDGVELRLGGQAVLDLDAIDVVDSSPGEPPEHELLVEAAR